MKSDRTWKTPRAVAVESSGFYAASPVWKKKGKVYILLTSDQMAFLVDFLPEPCQWNLTGHERRTVSGYTPHQWLGYSEEKQPCEMPIGSSRGNLIVDAGELLALLRRVETSYTCQVKNGTRVVIALLQAVIGETTTGRAVLVRACEGCDGQGSTGDYARGTGKTCSVCEGAGEVREQAPLRE